jgi:transcriptional regulator of acetoin/glycerol metabolism
MTDEERELRRALTEAEGSPTKAGVLLGVTRMTVHRRMKKYGIEIKRVVDRAA